MGLKLRRGSEVRSQCYLATNQMLEISRINSGMPLIFLTWSLDRDGAFYQGEDQKHECDRQNKGLPKDSKS